MTFENMVWNLSDDTTYTSDTEIEIKTLLLNDHILALGSADSDITVTDNMTFDSSSERFNSGLADITLENSISLEDGAITSTGGIVYLEKGGSQSGGELDVTSSTLKLGDDYSKSGGTLTSTENGTTLELTDNLTLTSNTVMAMLGLTLNDNTLTLGSDTSGLTVGGPITLDHADEQILANAADLNLKGLLSVNNGSISSDNASLKITGGINQTGGQLKLNNAQLELAGDISLSLIHI